MTRQAISWTEEGFVPDAIVRSAIRRLLRDRLATLRSDDVKYAAEQTARFVAAMADAPIAPLPRKANEQHYEVPADFFAQVLGPHLKYSACFWGEGVASLGEAERSALDITCQRAELADGQEILELGCGWGSLTLYMAERYPRAAIVAVSNSNAQRAYIVSEARRRRLDNITVLTCDMNEFTIERQFDRVISIEMFEHMRNYARLFARVSGWLALHGKFFLHIFAHRCVPYAFEDQREDDWMSRHFFSGGMMPSADLPLYFQDHLRLQRRWTWSGLHYARTASAWLANLDERRAQVLPMLAATSGADTAEIRLQRWRMFFMACAELWGFDAGREWLVCHYLFERRHGNEPT
jgi:cyclopropane-fatty-acyl-phospholipid synthase